MFIMVMEHKKSSNASNPRYSHPLLILHSQLWHKANNNTDPGLMKMMPRMFSLPQSTYLMDQQPFIQVQAKRMSLLQLTLHFILEVSLMYLFFQGLPSLLNGVLNSLNLYSLAWLPSSLTSFLSQLVLMLMKETTFTLLGTLSWQNLTINGWLNN